MLVNCLLVCTALQVCSKVGETGPLTYLPRVPALLVMRVESCPPPKKKYVLSSCRRKTTGGRVLCMES